MTKSSRPIAFAALLLACVLLPAGFFSHGHDDGDLGDHDHDCIICCLRDHSTLVATTTAPVPAAPDLPAPAAAAMRDQRGHKAALGARTTRGPPA